MLLILRRLFLAKKCDNEDGAAEPKWSARSSELPLPPSIADGVVEEELARSSSSDLSGLCQRLHGLTKALLSRREQFRSLTQDFDPSQLTEPRTNEPEFT